MREHTFLEDSYYLKRFNHASPALCVCHVNVRRWLYPYFEAIKRVDYREGIQRVLLYADEAIVSAPGITN